jgi:LDH2 family malate/lactate/ureidoglycolate dehydrogenase
MGDRVNASALRRWLADVLEAAGMASEPAAIAAEVLVRTSLRGIDTHGVIRILDYVERLRSGELDAGALPAAEIRDNVVHVDGNLGLGQPVGRFAGKAAVALARTVPFVPCLIRRSGHLAAIGMFALEAAEQGMLAVICQQTPPIMAPAGARRAAIGNNPLAFAMPLPGRPPLAFDMAASVVARGRVAAAAREGRPIPPDWAIGPDGRATTDAALAMQGAVLPMAGHKGIGLAMLVQCLAGSLAGSAAGAGPADGGPAQSSPADVSAFLLVVNPALVIGQAAFEADANAWLSTYLAACGAGARYPGQRAAECEADRIVHGIPLATAVQAALARLGASLQRPFPADGG